MRRILPLIVVLTCVLLATQAFGDCRIYGKVVYIYHAGAQISTDQRTVIYIAPLTTLPTTYYVFRTEKMVVIEMATAAMAGNHTVLVQGDVDQCPTGGVIRSLGVAKTFVSYKNR